MRDRQKRRAVGSTSTPAPSRVRKAARVALAALFAAVVALAVALLWRPSPAKAVYPPGNFTETIARSPIAAAMVELPAYGSSRVIVRDSDLANLAAAALGRNDSSVPPEVAEAVSEAVPAWVETVAGCEIHPDRQTLYVRGRKIISFYVTISGRLRHLADGGLAFELTSLKLGLLPLPLGLVRDNLGLEDATIIDPAAAGFRVTEFAPEEGRLTLKVEEYLGEP